MAHTTKVLIVTADADADQTMPAGSPERWLITTVSPAPLAGIFATGDTFADARANLAEIVLLAAQTALSDHANDIDAVRIHAVTRKTFPVAQLNQASNGGQS